MFRNTLALPLIALLLAAAGAALLVADLTMKSTATASNASPRPTLDGQISENEYANHYRSDELQLDLYWTLDQENIYIALRSPGKGWLAIGLNPEGPAMQGADILVGYVQDGILYMRDDFAESPTGHSPDKDLGGQENISESAGSESEQGTVIEFVRKLDTQDDFDKPIIGGTMTVQLAYSETDDFVSYHSKRAAVTIDFFSQSD